MPQTINEVISDLENIKAECRTNNSTLGFFALLYCEVTKSVKQGIEEKTFEDNLRMEKLDVLFAKRYIEAYNNYKNGKEVSESWRVAFNNANAPLLILQHIFLGINAHINLDLGIAAAETVPNENIEIIKNDFEGINELLGSMIDDFQDKLNAVSPLFKLLDKWMGNSEEMIMQFTIKIARTGAWKFTKQYHSSTTKDSLIASRDQKVSAIGKLLTLTKSFWIKLAIKAVRLFEEKDVNKIMDSLEGK